jgi:ATP-dependent DNA helicase RecQ
MDSSRNILKQYWNFDKFRPLQEDIVDASINGMDVFALLPTGGGKSICFQVPGIAREGLCLVISPLIALMQDQVNNLNKRGLRAKAITSGMSYRDIDITLDNARFGGLDFLYTSPERLQSSLFIERFKQFKLSLIVIDEAHCISEWGHDFRPSYRKIVELRQFHPSVPVMAVTATATPETKKDIVIQLQMKDPSIFEISFERSNLSYEVYHIENKLNALLNVCKKFEGKTGIVYCQTRKNTKDIALFLRENRIRSGVYHGGLSSDERTNMLNAWLKNDISIMVATNAFGMGIDKSDVRFVIHSEMSNSIEGYFQEAGRAGRDGFAARTMVFYSDNDLDKLRNNLIDEFPPMEDVKYCYKAICNYLGLAFGSGLGETFPLDLSVFAKRYDYSITKIFHCIKILELNGNLLFNEASYNPTKVKFVVGAKKLYSFQIEQSKYAGLITYLTRTYPGIHDNFYAINEFQALKQLQLSSAELKSRIENLEKYGILEVNWQTNLPLVTFLEERWHDDHFTINASAYKLRKERAETKLFSVESYLKNPICRNIQLLAYFGQDGEKCGKCDICKSESNSTLSLLEIKKAILSLIKTNSKTFQELESELDTIPKKMIDDAYFDLQDFGNLVLVDDKITFIKDL